MITIQVQIKDYPWVQGEVSDWEGVQRELLRCCPQSVYWPGWWFMIIYLLYIFVLCSYLYLYFKIQKIKKTNKHLLLANRRQCLEEAKILHLHI